MGKIVEGYWDCKYCDNKGISGLEKHCPACGHPQDEGTKFYVKDKKVYVDEAKASQYGKGADWTCAYCGSLNRHDALVCAGCGADREENTGDYFENQVKQEAKAREKAEAENPTPVKAKPGKGRYIFFGILLAIIAFIVIGAIPKHKSSEISAKSWDRAIEVESYETVSESDWEVPSGGTVTDKKEEIKSYDHVIDHYETVEVEKSREVEDGYDISNEYIDNGDGTFTEEEVKTPRYKTEYYTETEEQPVYKDVPVYATKYYYDIDKWIYNRTEEASGEGDEVPYWPEHSLTDNERDGKTTEEYIVTCTTDKGKVYTVEVNGSLYEELKLGDGVEITIEYGNIKTINGVNVM